MPAWTERLCRFLGELAAGRRSLSALQPRPAGQPVRRSASGKPSRSLEAVRCRDRSAGRDLPAEDVFGKWCRPNYNSVIATFCHNIAHDLPIQISDPRRMVELVYIDDVVAALMAEMAAKPRMRDWSRRDPIPSCSLTLGDLAGRIQCFRDMRDSLQVPDFSERL